MADGRCCCQRVLVQTLWSVGVGIKVYSTSADQTCWTKVSVSYDYIITKLFWVCWQYDYTQGGVPIPVLVLCKCSSASVPVQVVSNGGKTSNPQAEPRHRNASQKRHQSVSQAIKSTETSKKKLQLLQGVSARLSADYLRWFTKHRKQNEKKGHNITNHETLLNTKLCLQA